VVSGINGSSNVQFEGTCENVENGRKLICAGDVSKSIGNATRVLHGDRSGNEFRQGEAIYSQIIDQTVDQFSHIDPLFISDEVKQLIDSYILPQDSELERVDKLQDILYGEDYLHITYEDHKTHTALEAFHAREGNCLGVMNLYIAMARYVGVDANFQTVAVRPNWDLRGDLLVLSQHIKCHGSF